MKATTERHLLREAARLGREVLFWQRQIARQCGLETFPGDPEQVLAVKLRGEREWLQGYEKRREARK